MIGGILVGLALVGVDGGGVDRRVAVAPADFSAYQEAQRTAGRDAAAQVRLALWCEAHGLTAERMKHLALAVLSDPSHATARGLLGLVAHQGKWERPEALGRRIEDDPADRERIREYLGRRAKA